jgi:hypothetical protein
MKGVGTMTDKRVALTLALGSGISLVALVVRLNARAIAWPKSASWGSQVEATPFYASQLAISDVADLFLAFGLALIVAAVVRSLFAKIEIGAGTSSAPSDLRA